MKNKQKRIDKIQCKISKISKIKKINFEKKTIINNQPAFKIMVKFKNNE